MKKSDNIPWLKGSRSLIPEYRRVFAYCGLASGNFIGRGKFQQNLPLLFADPGALTEVWRMKSIPCTETTFAAGPVQ